MNPVARIVLLALTSAGIASAAAETIAGRGGEKYNVEARTAAAVLQGQLASMKQDHARAVQHFTAALALNPPAPAVAAIYDMRGAAYFKTGDLDRALQDAAQCIRLEPRLFGGYETRGLVYRRRAKFDLAIDDYNRALALNPNSTQLLNNRGVAYSAKGDEQRAIRDFNEAIRREPNALDGYVNRGASYANINESEKAIADYNTAIRLNPRDGDAYFNRGLLRKKLGKVDDAIRDFGESIRRNPNDPDGYYARGQALAAKREYQRAASELRRALDLKPANNDILNSLSWLRATCPDETVRDGREAVQLSLRTCGATRWKNPTYIDTLAASYAEAGDFAQAVKYQTRAISLESNGDEKRNKEKRLAHFQAGKAWRDAVE